MKCVSRVFRPILQGRGGPTVAMETILDVSLFLFLFLSRNEDVFVRTTAEDVDNSIESSRPAVGRWTRRLSLMVTQIVTGYSWKETLTGPLLLSAQFRRFNETALVWKEIQCNLKAKCLFLDTKLDCRCVTTVRWAGFPPWYLVNGALFLKKRMQTHVLQSRLWSTTKGTWQIYSAPSFSVRTSRFGERRVIWNHKKNPSTSIFFI